MTSICRSNGLTVEMGWFLTWVVLQACLHPTFKHSSRDWSTPTGITHHPYSPPLPLWVSQLHPIAHLCERLGVTVNVITGLSVQELAKCPQILERALIRCVLCLNRLQNVCCTSARGCFDYSCYSVLICAPKVQ